MEPRGNIDDILNEQEEVETDDTGIDTVDDTGTADDSIDDTGTGEQTGDKPAASPAATPDTETVAALRAEIDRIRNKNREYEAALLQRQAPAAPQPAAEEPPSFWDNPEAVINQAVGSVRQEMTQRLVDISEASAKIRHADYKDKLQVFSEIVQQNPAVYQEMLRQPDPAEWAYQVAARQSVMRDIGDPVQYRSKIEAEIRAQIAAEKAAEDKKKADDLIASKLPSGFSEARNVGTGQKTTQFNPNLPMKDILAGPKKK